MVVSDKNELSKVNVRLLQSAGKTVPDSWFSDSESSVTQLSTGLWNSADVGDGRIEMTASSVVGYELAFLQDGLASLYSTVVY